jgi:short-subunit dehydrogenase
MSTRTLAGSRAIVTGASSGIGRALAMELAREGVRLVVVARRADRLAALADEIQSAGGAVKTLAADVTEPAARQRAVDTAVSAYGGLDILVNNAGIGAFGRFEQADPERLRRVMEVNFFALVELTRVALPELKRGTKPIVVNISSVLGHRAVPRSAEYCASKFAVQGFSEAIRVELRRHGIDVLVVCPGLTQTEFTKSATSRGDKPDWPQHAGVSTEYVARRTARAIRAGKREIMPFAWGRVLRFANQIAPSLVDRILARYA